MGLLFSRDAPPPQRVHDVAFCGWFPAGLVHEVLGEHLAPSPCLDREAAWKHPEAGLPPFQMTSGWARAARVSRELWCQEKG